MDMFPIAHMSHYVIIATVIGNDIPQRKHIRHHPGSWDTPTEVLVAKYLPESIQINRPLKKRF